MFKKTLIAGGFTALVFMTGACGVNVTFSSGSHHTPTPKPSPTAQKSTPVPHPILINNLGTLENQAAIYGFKCSDNQQAVQDDGYGNYTQACIDENGDTLGFMYSVNTSDVADEAASSGEFSGSSYAAGPHWLVVSNDVQVTELQSLLAGDSSGEF